MFEQYREGVADRAAALAAAELEENEIGEDEEGDGGKDKAKQGGKKRRHSVSAGEGGGQEKSDGEFHHPVDDVLRELGLGEFALDGGNPRRGNITADFCLGRWASGDGREEEGSRFLRLLRQAACPGAMLQG